MRGPAESNLEKGRPEPYIYRYIRCTYGRFSREITIHAVIYGADIRLRPTLLLSTRT
jgi:hypothetical protein